MTALSFTQNFFRLCPLLLEITDMCLRDPESGWLVGEVVELPGCYTQAPDLPTLEAYMREAIVAYLKSL